MEPINTKLYDKYKNLKRRRLLQEEEWIRETDVNLKNYQSATEDLIEELKNDNDRLRTELSSMQQQYCECEKSLLEESKKCKELSYEVAKLQNLLSETSKDNVTAISGSPNTTPRGKASKELSSTKGPNLSNMEAGSQHEEPAITPIINSQDGQIVPHCCRQISPNLVDTSEDCNSCIFKTLIEFIIGMKFSVKSQAEGLCILVIHQTSGYTFTLTLTQGGEGELKYRASSLGTLERVALDWMKEEIAFSMTMCRAFFERISRVIGRR